MQKITPFLWFDNNAEEAAKFYVSVFKQKARIRHVTRFPADAPGRAANVTVVDFQLFGRHFTALNGGPMFKFTEAVSMVVHCETQREIDYYWRRLTSGGGKPSRCGWLKDKYGLSWQIVPTQTIQRLCGRDRATANRVMQALLRMGKLNIRQLERAAAKR